jgi:prepilin-type processing-associated H-X9-DG protein
MMRLIGAKRGFTLADLTICIAIIAILAAILFPVFARAHEKARAANCMTNLINIGLALRTYAADNDMLYPPRDNDLRPLWPVYWQSAAPLFSCPSTSHKGVKMGAKPGDYPEDETGYRAGSASPPPPVPVPGTPPGVPGPAGEPMPGPPPPPAESPATPWPEDPVAEGATCYFYVSGYRHDQLIRRAPLAGDLSAWHNDRRNVLFTDGSMRLWSKGQYLESGLDDYAWMDGPQ